MKKLIELYRGGGYSLVMTTAAAGSVGPSWDVANKIRAGLLETAGVEKDKVFFVRQQHSKTVIDTDEHSFSPVTEADGMVTGRRNDSLAVTAADCMPVYLHDEKNNVRALLHSGWKGTGIILNAIKLMNERYGSLPEHITAVLGPAIGSCCYNVDRSRAEAFTAEWGSSSAEFRDGEYFISLKNANKGILERAGVKNIIASDLCTVCDKRFGSFRREGPDKFTLMFVLSYLNVG